MLLSVVGLTLSLVREEVARLRVMVDCAPRCFFGVLMISRDGGGGELLLFTGAWSFLCLSNKVSKKRSGVEHGFVLVRSCFGFRASVKTSGVLCEFRD